MTVYARRLALVFACLLAVISAATVRAADAQRGATVTLSMLDITSSEPAMKVLLQNFERVYPNIQVNATYVTSSQLPALLLTEFQGGNAPDLFYASAGNVTPTAIFPLAKAGDLLKLTNLPYQSRVPSSMKGLLGYKGSYYGYPLAYFLYGVVYNETLFQQLGLTIPKSFSAALAMCKKITAAGKVPFEQGFAEYANAAILPEQRAAQYVYSPSPKWDDLRSSGKTTFTKSTGWGEVWQSILEMKNAGCFQPGPQATPFAQQAADFASGKAVMSVMASTQIGSIKAINPSIKLGFFNLPGDNATKSAIAVGAVLLAANSHTHQAGAVETLLRFLGRPKQAALYAQISGGNSYYDLYKSSVPSWQSSLASYVKAGKLVPLPGAFWPNAAAFVTLGNGPAGLMTGQSSVQKLLSALDYLWDNPSATSAP